MLQVKSIVNGHFCWFNEQNFGKEWVKARGKDICPVCNTKLNLDDKIYMVINNGKLFPNTLIHKSCIINDMTMTTRILMDDYNKYHRDIKKLHRKHRGWFNK